MYKTAVYHYGIIPKKVVDFVTGRKALKRGAKR